MVAVARAIEKLEQDERRRFQRVRVDLLGRFMLSDRREFPCQIIDMSPGGAAILAPVSGQLFERVVVYADHVGRVEGVVMRVLPNGFAMTVDASIRKRDKLADQLTWLANRNLLGLPEDRRHERVIPTNPMTTLTLPNGEKTPARVIDISLSGVAIASRVAVKPGDIVQVSRTMGRVARMLDGGFAIEFSSQQPIETIIALGADLGAPLRRSTSEPAPSLAPGDHPLASAPAPSRV